MIVNSLPCYMPCTVHDHENGAVAPRGNATLREAFVAAVSSRSASDQLPLRGSLTLCGPVRAVGPGRVLDTPAET